MTRLIHTCDMTHSHVRIDSFTHVTWLIHTCDVIHFSCVMWLNHVCDITHPYAWHDSVIYAKWLIHMCDMTYQYVWYDSFICVAWLHPYDMTRSFVWHELFLCGVTYSYVWYDSCICAAWLPTVCIGCCVNKSTDSYLRHDSFIRLTWLIHVSRDSFIRVTWLLHMCGVTHVSGSVDCRWNHELMFDTWLNFESIMTPLYVRDTPLMRVTRHIHVCDSTIHTCDMSHTYLWKNTFDWVTDVCDAT